MNYREARVYLEESARYGSVPGLDRINALLGELNHPERMLNVIHVAGTNGKGSVCMYLSSVLKCAGYRVGCYTSPAVFSYLERFMINGKPMEEEDYGACMDVMRDAVKAMNAKGLEPPTVFEIETAIAFLYFSESNCDFLVMEAGLGGREDATNIVSHPLMTVITSISMDHMAWLGDTIEEIASQKAGIIKGGHPVILSPQTDSVRRVLYDEYAYREKERAVDGQKTGNSRPSPFRMTDRNDIQLNSRNLMEQCFTYKQYDLATSLLGDYELENAATAVLAIEVLQEMGYPVTSSHIIDGISAASWFGRFTVINTKPLLVLDGSHNEDGAARLKSSLEAYFPGRKFVFVMGVFKDKDYGKMLSGIAPLVMELYLVSLPDWNRSLIPGVLRQEATRYGLEGRICVNYSEAALRAGKDAGENGIVVAFGSLSYLKPFLTAWEKEYPVQTDMAEEEEEENDGSADNQKS